MMLPIEEKGVCDLLFRCKYAKTTIVVFQSEKSGIFNILDVDFRILRILITAFTQFLTQCVILNCDGWIQLSCECFITNRSGQLRRKWRANFLYLSC